MSPPLTVRCDLLWPPPWFRRPLSVAWAAASPLWWQQDALTPCNYKGRVSAIQSHITSRQRARWLFSHCISAPPWLFRGLHISWADWWTAACINCLQRLNSDSPLTDEEHAQAVTQIYEQGQDMQRSRVDVNLTLCLRVHNSAAVQQYKLWHFLWITPMSAPGRYEWKCVQYVETSPFLENKEEDVHLMEKPRDKKKLCIYQIRSNWS